ncbi:uncharacterized protein [Fopius arisanus]|uniref:Uncharacterized protein n=1 Tax=Fopius arisanus TaxID=64838 RepID=A0A9R1TRJ2_9HYME|nr:PREDICTED: uncharacterized protein LOC105273571 [Fopius arisanus]
MNYTSLWHVILILLSCFGVSYADNDELQINRHRIGDGTTTAVPVFNKSETIVTINKTTPTPVITTAASASSKYTTSAVSTTGTRHTTKNNEYMSTNPTRLTTTTAIPPDNSTNCETKIDLATYLGGCAVTAIAFMLGLCIFKMHANWVSARNYLSI